MRVLIIAHGHPALSPGGGERAAYALFEHLKAHPKIESAIFVARSEPASIGHSAPLGAFRGRPDEILASPMHCHEFTHLTTDYTALDRIVSELIDRYRPDVAHVHHFVHWGIEILEILRRHGVRVVFTLHEFIAICHRQGQMLKTNGRLCSYASSAECAACFPQHSPGRFFLRERIIKSFLECVHHFISPSRFLADRFVDWGIARDKISVIENPLGPGVLQRAEALTVGQVVRSELVRPRGEGEEPDKNGMVGAPLEQASAIKIKTKIGFFGQINPYKGVDVLLQALARLSERERERIVVGLHGARLEIQTEEFRQRFSELLKNVSDNVVIHAPYENEKVLNLMTQYDWIIVPSVWWENSPVVIQEALAVGKPLICSRIGGMEEKAVAGANVVLFEPGNAGDLAEALRNLPPAGHGVASGQHDAARFVEEIITCYAAPGPGRTERRRPKQKDRHIAEDTMEPNENG